MKDEGEEELQGHWRGPPGKRWRLGVWGEKARLRQVRNCDTQGPGDPAEGLSNSGPLRKGGTKVTTEQLWSVTESPAGQTSACVTVTAAWLQGLRLWFEQWSGGASSSSCKGQKASLAQSQSS